MIRRPPRSTLFPTRRSSDLDGNSQDVIGGSGIEIHVGVDLLFADHQVFNLSRDLEPFQVSVAAAQLLRSEEHTSELQSHVNLVCRLLLEKKKLISIYNIFDI